MLKVPHAGRIFLSLWLVFVFYADPLLEISTVRHLYLARAIAEHGSFIVDEYVHASRGDLAFNGGHYFSGSPPGLGFALVPVAALRAALEPVLPFRPNQVLQVMALLLFQAPVAALVILLFWGLLIELGYSSARAAGVALTLGLATPLLFFTSKLSDYPLASLFMIVAARTGLSWRRGQETAGSGLAAGLVLGLAWTVNDLAALLTAAMMMLGGGRATVKTWGGRIALVALGALPGLLARGTYSTACFGSPFANPLSFSAAGITVVDEYASLGGPTGAIAAMVRQLPQMAWDLTLGDVGIFLFAPATIVLFGWRRARDASNTSATSSEQQAMARAGFLVFLLNAALHVFLLNGLWTGGASWGPRYLLFSSVPLALTAAWAAGGWSTRATSVLAAVSGLVTWIGVQYGYSTSVLASLGHLLLGGPTTPACRWLWIHWALVPTPERAALVWQETPRLGAYYALTHPSPFVPHLLLLLLLAVLWRPVIGARRIYIA